MKPKRTFQSVARGLAEGLRDGTVRLDEATQGEPPVPDENAQGRGVTLEIDVPEHASDEDIRT